MPKLIKLPHQQSTNVRPRSRQDVTRVGEAQVQAKLLLDITASRQQQVYCKGMWSLKPGLLQDKPLPWCLTPSGHHPAPALLLSSQQRIPTGAMLHFAPHFVLCCSLCGQSSEPMAAVGQTGGCLQHHVTDFCMHMRLCTKMQLKQETNRI